MISHLDDGFGRIIEELRSRAMLENTIIVVAGDNGLAVGRHGLMGKQNLYEHSVRVPLIFAGPGIEPGTSSDALVYLLDIFPTLCELTETPIPGSVEGRSLAACMKGGHTAGRDTLYLAYGETIRGISNSSHKLIEYACGATQLFDLHSDPHEMNNLADAPESRDLLRNLRTRLLELADAWDDKQHPTGAAFWKSRSDI
jgi:arylsulfatase A-like enzyme